MKFIYRPYFDSHKYLSLIHISQFGFHPLQRFFAIQPSHYIVFSIFLPPYSSDPPQNPRSTSFLGLPLDLLLTGFHLEFFLDFSDVPSSLCVPSQAVLLLQSLRHLIPNFNSTDTRLTKVTYCCNQGRTHGREIGEISPNTYMVVSNEILFTVL